MTIKSDNIACEILSQETIFIELDRRGASVCDDNGLDPLFTVQIEDSTRECDTRAYMCTRRGLLAVVHVLNHILYRLLPPHIVCCAR